MTDKYSEASYARRMQYTPEERSARASLMAKARWKGTTKQERVEHAKMMIKAKQKSAKKSIKKK